MSPRRFGPQCNCSQKEKLTSIWSQTTKELSLQLILLELLIDCHSWEQSSSLWLQEQPCFDQTPSYCLFFMLRPSYSFPKASYSLPISMAVPPRCTSEEKTTKLDTLSVPRYTTKGSLSSQMHFSSISPTHHGGWAQSSKQDEEHFDFPVTHPLKTTRLQKRSPARRLRVPRVQCSSSTALHALDGAVPFTVSRFCTVLKRCCARFPAAAIFNPHCLYISDREQIPPG